MTRAERLEEIRKRADKATPGPWETAIYDKAKEPIEWLRECLSHGSGPVHLTWCPEHPLTQGLYPRPEHAVVPAITGNGPTSEANAVFVAAARSDVPWLLEEITRLADVVCGEFCGSKHRRPCLLAEEP
jgi:hypothetical protein